MSRMDTHKCPGPAVIGAWPCGRDVVQTSTVGRRRTRCPDCGTYQARKAEEARIALQGPYQPLRQTILPAPLYTEPETPARQPISSHCTWLEADGTICDASLADTDEVYCAHHGLPPRAYDPNAGQFRGPGILVMDEVPETERVPGPIEQSHIDSLTAIDRIDHPEAKLVLLLARRMDDGVSDSALAAVAGRLQSASKDAYAGAAPVPGRMDELRRKREARLAAMQEQLAENDS